MPQDFDVALKQLLRTSTRVLWQQLTGAPVAEWLNVELPKVENRRVDFLARLEDGRCVHLELQSTNERYFARRMAEYYLSLQRLVDDSVEPIGLYVGKEPLSMTGTYRTKYMDFHFPLIDVRTLDGMPLLQSPDLGDNILALLTGTDKRQVVPKLARRLRELSPDVQRIALAEIMILSGLRDVEEYVLQELGPMPLIIDIRENKVLGPPYVKGLLEGQRKILRRQLTKRFGTIPRAFDDRVESASEDELEHWLERFVDAPTLEAVFD